MDLDKLNLVKLEYGGSDLSSSQFLLLFRHPQKITLASKVFKSDLKIVILLHLPKSVKHSVEIEFNKRMNCKQRSDVTKSFCAASPNL